MRLDVSLPSILFLVTVAVVFLYERYEKKIKSLFEGRELRTRDVVLLVIAMSGMVTVLAVTHYWLGIAIMVFFLYVYSVVLFLFTYLVVPKWYVGALVSALFLELYLLYKDTPIWNPYLLNVFAFIFVICISVYLGGMFTWKTTTVFVVLLTAMDIIQVLVTGFMVESSEKLLALQFPVVVILPLFPLANGLSRISLGLGDIFLFGLLGIQLMQKYGRKSGLASTALTAEVFLLLETILLNSYPKAFPATVLIISGWLTAVGTQYLDKRRLRRV